jgi:hypothetical protein
MLEIDDALKIAVTELKAKHRMPAPEKYKLHAGRVRDRWVFWFVLLPETPGHDFTMFVSDTGETRFMPGR